MLTIDRLVVRGKISRRSNVDQTLIDRITREELAVECSRQLNQSWPVQSRAARIRQLRVRLSIPASQLQRDSFVKAWTAAFLRELFAALAHPHNIEIVQFQSRAEYVAAAIRDLLNGDTGQRWAYQEFEHLFDTSIAETVLHLFRREQAQLVPILLILEDWSLLDQLLVVWDEAGLEQFFIVIAGQDGEKRPAIEDLIRAWQLFLECHPGEVELAAGSSLIQGRIALKLFLSAARRIDEKNATLPGTIFQALRILRALLNLLRTATNSLHSLTDLGGPAGDSNSPSQIRPGSAVEIRNSIPARSDEVDLLNEFWSMIASAPDPSRAAFVDVLHKLTSATNSASQRRQLAELENVLVSGRSENQSSLAALIADLTSVPSHSPESKWIPTDCAGLFLLVRVLDKLGWEDDLARSSLGATYGPPLLTYTLSGIATAVLGRFNEELAYLDPGITLFSGWLGAPDLRGFRVFLAAGSVETRQAFLGELLTQSVAIEYSAAWQTCFDALGNYVIREFTEQIRCFGKPSRSFIIKNFVALPGRILIEEKRLVVMFTSSPLHVVIHLSGLDYPIESVSWLGGRRIEFQADGF